MISPRARVVGICEPSAVGPQGLSLGHLKEQDMLLTAVISLVTALLILIFLIQSLQLLFLKALIVNFVPIKEKNRFTAKAMGTIMLENVEFFISDSPNHVTMSFFTLNLGDYEHECI